MSDRSLVMDDGILRQPSDIAEIAQLKKLLELAKCPDENCDGEGTCSRWPVPGYDGEADIDIWQCQWCDERHKALTT